MTSDAWVNRIVGEGEVAAGELVAHPQNWRKHPKEQAAQLQAGLGGVGWVQRVIVNRRTGRMLDGHLRAELARRQGEATPVPVVYVDLSEDEERTVLATLDPIAGMAIADEATLAGLVRSIEDADLRSIAGSVAQVLNVDVDGKADAGADTEPQIDRAEELREKWGVQPGDLWQLGEHRLICGDCTDAAVVARVMGGERAALVSDPPYGISVDTSWLSALNVQRGKPANASDDLLIGDDGTLDLSWVYQYPQWLVFGFPYIARTERYTGLLVWDKRGDGGEDGLGNPVEVAASNTFNGYRLSRHVWAGYIREAGEKRHPHPTQKPVGIMADAIELVKGQIIYDPFSGSGTTLIACENLGRRCRAVEIAPGYVAVALERWATHTGKTPVRVEAG